MKIPLSNIKILEGWNNRIDLDIPEDGEFYQSIANKGIVQAVIGRWEDESCTSFIISDGHRRRAVALKVCESRGIDPAAYQVPIQQEEEGTTEVDRLCFQATLNDTGKPLTVVERSRLVHHLHHEHNLSITAISEHLGVSHVTVLANLTLSEGATEKLNQLIDEDRISGSLASELINHLNHRAVIIDRHIDKAIEAAGEGKKLTKRHFDCFKSPARKKTKKKPVKTDLSPPLSVPLDGIKTVIKNTEQHCQNNKLETLNKVIEFLNGDLSEKDLEDFITGKADAKPFMI